MLDDSEVVASGVALPVTAVLDDAVLDDVVLSDVVLGDVVLGDVVLGDVLLGDEVVAASASTVFVILPPDDAVEMDEPFDSGVEDSGLEDSGLEDSGFEGDGSLGVLLDAVFAPALDDEDPPEPSEPVPSAWAMPEPLASAAPTPRVMALAPSQPWATRDSGLARCRPFARRARPP